MSPISIIAGDFNNDTKIDLAVTNRGDNTISVLLGYGNGTFRTQISYTVGIDPVSLVAGDFNSDAKIDLAIVDMLSNDISILLNQCSTSNS